MELILESMASCWKGMLESSLGCLRGRAAERFANLFNLEDNAGTLDREMEVLLQTREDLMAKILTLELNPKMKRTPQTSGWLESVEALEQKVRAVQDSLARRSTIPERCSCDSLGSDWMLGEEVAASLKRLAEVKGQRSDLDSQLVDEAPPDPVVPIPRTSPRIVGGEKALSAIRSYIRDDGAGIIGIFGMGGVGKTTLLAEINNQLLAEGNTGGFDTVIFVTISKEVNIPKIQEDISVRLGHSRGGDEGSLELPGNRYDRRDALFTALSQRKFLLLLDDLWKKLDLESIGIPLPEAPSKGNRKIVFTTRFEEVCDDMNAQTSKVRVDLLDDNDSWELLCSKMEPTVDLGNDVEIIPVAKQVVKKCGGLPLALITVGRAMSTATSVGEWRQAALMLKETPNKLRGMEDVLSILRFSLEKLEDRISVRCLLYCSIFPEDYNFEMDQLIDYWICEGFLDTEVPESDSLLEARQKGRGIIEKLRNACLLEDGEDEDEVKMHDVVREMALWLTGDEEYMGRNERSIVCGEKGLERLQEVGTWTGAKRISMMQDDVHALPFPESECSNLSTALLGGKFVNPFEELSIPPGLFESMPALRVLDLSHTSIKELPDAIGSLGELRYLNLSLTSLRRLPKELGRLAKLRNLDLRYTDELLDIPEEAFLTLGSLQALDLHDCGYMWNAGEGGGITLEGLENHLERLEELSVSICSVSCLVTLSNLERLRRCAWEVQLQQVEDLTWDLNLSETLERLNLQVLRLERCPELQMLKVDYGSNQFRRLRTMVLRSLVNLGMVTGGTETTQGDGEDIGGSVPCPPLFPMLRDLDITYCNRLSDLRWAGRLPHLEWIHLSSCKGIEKLLHDDEQGDDGQDPLFPKLMRLTLDNLPALRSISSRRLLFPSLKVLWVERCPRLKRLPVGDDGGLKNIRKIGSEAPWWDALEWDDCDDSGFSHTKATLAPFFRPQPEPEPSTSEDEI